jgi:hypothetical protein
VISLAGVPQYISWPYKLIVEKKSMKQNKNLIKIKN